MLPSRAADPGDAGASLGLPVLEIHDAARPADGAPPPPPPPPQAAPVVPPPEPLTHLFDAMAVAGFAPRLGAPFPLCLCGVRLALRVALPGINAPFPALAHGVVEAAPLAEPAALVCPRHSQGAPLRLAPPPPPPLLLSPPPPPPPLLPASVRTRSPVDDDECGEEGAGGRSAAKRARLSLSKFLASAPRRAAVDPLHELPTELFAGGQLDVDWTKRHTRAELSWTDS